MDPQIGLLDVLPNELVLQIAFILPIRDVLSLNCATRKKLGVLEQRIDTSLYMQSLSPFNDCKKLLEELATHGAVLSGSRALEYFVPGSCTASSDWDFYAPPLLMSVAAVKKAIEASGVVFESTLERVAKVIQRGLPVTLYPKQMVSIAYEASPKPRPLSDEENLIVKGIYREHPVLRDILDHIHPDGSTRWIEDLAPIVVRACGSVGDHEHDLPPSSYPEDVSGRVLWGAVQGVANVQLMVGNMDPRRTSLANPLSKSVFTNIFAFYGSHVQCMLTKHAAFHMYYDLAVQKMAYRWQVSQAVRARADHAVEKYISRGFEFLAAPGNDEATCRSPQDSGSCLVELHSEKSYSPSLSEIKQLRWSHLGGFTRQGPQSGAIDARKEMLRFGILSIT